MWNLKITLIYTYMEEACFEWLGFREVGPTVELDNSLAEGFFSLGW